MASQTDLATAARTHVEAAPASFTPPTSFEVFVFGLSIISIINIVLLFLPLSSAQHSVIKITDAVLCFFFLLDFLFRYRNSADRRRYFFRDWGWLDLLGSLPAPGLRLLRSVRMWRIALGLKRMGGDAFYRRIVRDRASSALYAALFLAIVIFEVCSILVLSAESHASDANIKTGSDALWWSYVTVATVGYGDRYPVTNWGRIVGVLLMSVGVGLFGVFTGFLANKFLSPKSSGQEDTQIALGALRREVQDLERIVADLRAATMPVDGKTERQTRDEGNST